MYFNIYFLQYCCLLTINGTADSHMYTYHPMTTQQKNGVSIHIGLKHFNIVQTNISDEKIHEMFCILYSYNEEVILI